MVPMEDMKTFWSNSSTKHLSSIIFILFVKFNFSKLDRFLYKIALNYADDNQMEYIDIKKMGGYAIEGLDYLFQTLSKFYPDSLNPVLTDIGNGTLKLLESLKLLLRR